VWLCRTDSLHYFRSCARAQPTGPAAPATVLRPAAAAPRQGQERPKPSKRTL
jgi:hypothetical protein